MDYVHNLCVEFDKLEVMLARSIKLHKYKLTETYTNPWHKYAYPSLAFIVVCQAFPGP